MKRKENDMDDRKIIELLFDRDEQALAEIRMKYGRYCESVAQNILGCSADAESVRRVS